MCFAHSTALTDQSRQNNTIGLERSGHSSSFLVFCNFSHFKRTRRHMHTTAFAPLEGCLEENPFALLFSHAGLIPLTPPQTVTTSSAFPWPVQGLALLNNKHSVSHNCTLCQKTNKKTPLCATTRLKPSPCTM